MTDTEKQIQDLLLITTKMEKSQEALVEVQKASQEATTRAQDKTTENINKLTDSVLAIADVSTKIKSTNKRVDDLEDENSEGIRPKTLKHMLMYAVVATVGFVSYITLYTFSIDKDISTHKAQSKTEITNIKTEIKELKEKVIKNKNQITYVKAIKMNKPKG